MTRNMLRERVEGHHARVTNVELFFDLVFVFAITQLSHGLLAHLNVGGAIQTGLLILAVWWVWVFTTWMTNWLDPDHVGVRAMLFLLMAVGLVMTTSLPAAFGERAASFAVAYVAERCGLFIIICLGESILVTGATFGAHSIDPAAVGAFLAALIAAIAMWWIYFNAHADAGAHAIADSDDPGRIARVAYTYAHIPIVAGIIVTAAGDELAVAHPLGHMEATTFWLMLGGPALFLLGGAWFKFAVFRTMSQPRIAGVALLGLIIPAAPHLTPLALSAAATAALVVVAVWETLTLPAFAGPQAHACEPHA